MGRVRTSTSGLAALLAGAQRALGLARSEAGARK
jgi:hypothetical protein